MRSNSAAQRLVAERPAQSVLLEEIVQALFDEGVLLRNGVVKVTRFALATAIAIAPAGDPRFAYRPAADRAQANAANACGDRTESALGLLTRVGVHRMPIGANAH